MTPMRALLLLLLLAPSWCTDFFHSGPHQGSDVWTYFAPTDVNSNSPTFTRSTGAWDPYNHTIKLINQRRQRPISLFGNTYQADLIESARVNLLAVGTGEHFEAPFWTVGTGSPTVTADTAACPDGETVADSFVEGVANGTQSVSQSITKAAAATNYVGSVCFKNLSGSREVLIELDDGTTTNGVSMRVNPSTGAVTSAPAAFGSGWSVVTTSAPTGAFVEAAGSSFYRACLCVTSDATTTVRLRVALWNGSTTSYAGDGTSGVYLWAADVEARGFAQSIMLLRNMCTRSEDLTASWTKTRSTATGDTLADPLTGNTTADTLTEDNTASNTHLASVSAVTKLASSVTVTWSIYAKDNTRHWIALGVGASAALTNGVLRYFDLQNGVQGSTTTNGAGWAMTSTGMTSIGSGWYRCTITATTDTGTTMVAVVRLATADLTSSYSGGGTASVYLFGGQLEYGGTANSYYPMFSQITSSFADLLLSPTVLGQQGNFTVVAIPYGWTGDQDGSTAYRLMQDDTTGNRINRTNATSLIVSRSDASGLETSSRTHNLTAGAISVACVRWRPEGVLAIVDGVSGASEDTSLTPPFTTNTNLALGSTVGGGTLFDGWVWGAYTTIPGGNLFEQIIKDNVTAP